MHRNRWARLTYLWMKPVLKKGIMIFVGMTIMIIVFAPRFEQKRSFWQWGVKGRFPCCFCWWWVSTLSTLFDDDCATILHVNFIWLTLIPPCCFSRYGDHCSSWWVYIVSNSTFQLWPNYRRLETLMWYLQITGNKQRSDHFVVNELAQINQFTSLFYRKIAWECTLKLN